MSKIYVSFSLLFLLSLSYAQTQSPISSLAVIAGNFTVGVRPDGGNLNPNSNPQSLNIIKAEFNAIQPTSYPGRWVSKNKHHLDDFIAWVHWGKENKKVVMMHQLVSWNHYGPKWLIEGSWSKEELDAMLEFHIKKIVTSVGKKDVDVWNVVNESLRGWEDKGIEAGKFRVDSACVWNQLGWESDASGLTGAAKINDSIPIYIRKSFEYAKKYSPSILELRDYMFEFAAQNDRKLLAFYQLVKHLQNKGVSLGAVGFQCHINGTKSFDLSNKNWNNFHRNIQLFKSLGLKVYLTEVDIAAEKFKEMPFTEELALKQKAAYKLLVEKAVLAKVDGIFFWGVADGIDKGWFPFHKPLLFDEQYQKKPSYEGVLEALHKN
jgi:endo-1,4-beta-xylanase